MNRPPDIRSVFISVDLAREPDFALGPLQVRPSLRRVICDGRAEAVQPRVMQVLVALARARGGVVSREELIETCWDGLVVGDDSITHCIAKVRQLADCGGVHAFDIETIPRVGYRLVPSGPTAEPGDKTDADVPTPAVSPVAHSRRARSLWIAIAPVAVIAVALTVYETRIHPAASSRTAAVPVQASIAVLPFLNMSGDPKQEYFSDGFSEELINDLTNEPHLKVASRTSSFAFKAQSGSIKTIARALNVRAIVEGSVRFAGDRVRVTAQLVDASKGYHIWSADYTRNIRDILSLQDELARSISAELTHRLVVLPTVPRPKIEPAAYHLFLEGVHASDSGPQGWRTAFAMFRQVTARAPEFAGGFAWLARVAANLAINCDPTPASDYAVAAEAAQRALSIDPANAMARTFRALVELNTWNWRSGASDLRILESHNPNSYFAVSGMWNYYEYLGLPKQAFTSWYRLHTLDPQNYNTNFFTIRALEYAGRFQEEVQVTRAQLLRAPGDTYRLANLCSAYAATHQVDQARVVLNRLRSLATDGDAQFNFQTCEWSISLAAGDHSAALKLLHGWESEFPDQVRFGVNVTGISAAKFAAAYVLLGDFQKATDWFHRAYERRELDGFMDFDLRGFGFEQAIAKYRLTPGYKALSAKPLFRGWQAEHDRVAAALAAHRDPLN